MEQSCKIILDHLDDYLDDQLASSQRAVLEQHLSVCDQCCQLLEQAKDYFSSVHSMPLVAAPERLQQSILDSRFPENDVQHKPTISRIQDHKENATVHALHPASLARMKWQYFGAGVGVATAAAISLVLVLQLLWPDYGQVTGKQNEPGEKTAAMIKASSSVLAIKNQARHIYFLVDSPRALEDVTFSVIVPPNMHLQGYSKRQSLVWKGRLQQGENLLSLPLVATGVTPGVVVMRIDHHQAHKEYQVKVDVLSS